MRCPHPNSPYQQRVIRHGDKLDQRHSKHGARGIGLTTSGNTRLCHGAYRLICGRKRGRPPLCRAIRRGRRTAGTAIAQGRTPNKGDAIGSGIIGAVDNVGESMGGFVGGLVRLTAAGVKASVVADCRRDVRVQCDPESALRPYRERRARYEHYTAPQ